MARKQQCSLDPYSPAVEGGVGDDGDVRGELAPDPAKIKTKQTKNNKETFMGTNERDLEFGISWYPWLSQTLPLALAHKAGELGEPVPTGFPPPATQCRACNPAPGHGRLIALAAPHSWSGWKPTLLCSVHSLCHRAALFLTDPLSRHG